jgi:hypothetical protein
MPQEHNGIARRLTRTADTDIACDTVQFSMVLTKQ